MGYDMYTVQPADEAEKTAVAAAQARVRDLPHPFTVPEGEERDAAGKAWEDAWRALNLAEKSYFRLNITGMGRCCGFMDEVGMITGEDAPGFPTPDEYGLDEWPDDPADYEGDERKAAEAKLTPSSRKFLNDCQATTDYEPQPVNGIPVGKFSSNDGWLVTPAQCRAAVDKWKTAPLTAQRDIEAQADWWPSWIAFLDHAAERGGFRVH